MTDGSSTSGNESATREWDEHYPTDPELISGMLDGFTVNVNQTQVHFRCRDHIPMLVGIWIGDEENPIGYINTAKEETVTLGGVEEDLAYQVEQIAKLPPGEIPGALEELAYRLNPSGREEP